MIWRRLPALAAAATLAACGGNGNEVNGAYLGESIDVADAVLLPPVQDASGGAFSVVVLESAGDACTLMQAQTVNNTRAVSILLAIEAPDGTLSPSTVAGTYDIVGPLFRKPGAKIASVNFAVFGSCGPGTNGNARSGTVHLTHVGTNPDGTPSEIDGTFDARFGSGDGLSGKFHVSVCSGARFIVGVCR